MSPSTSFHCRDHSIDDYRPVRVIIAGAGLSGIISTIRLLQRIWNVSIQLYDKNSDFGETWHEHRYPGVANDTPTLSYQLTFARFPNMLMIRDPNSEIGTSHA